MDRTAQAPEGIRTLLEHGLTSRLAAALAAVHPADIARLLDELPLEHQVQIIRLLSPDRAGEVLPEVGDQTLLDLVRALGAGEVSRILERMPPDHAAEVVEELSAEEARAVLGLMGGARSAEVRELLEHPEGTAGRLMSPGGVTVPDSATAAQAIEQIRKSAREERGVEVYVVDDAQRVVGVVPLRRLLLAEPGTPVRTLQEAGAVIHASDATLSRVILLASFMPVIQAISGNTGLQSVAMVVRGLATGHVRLERWWEPLRRHSRPRRSSAACAACWWAWWGPSGTAPPPSASSSGCPCSCRSTSPGWPAPASPCSPGAWASTPR